MCHRPFLITAIPHLLLFIAVHQENGIIQRNPKLQDCRQRFGNIRNFPQKIITSQIVKNRHSNAQQKENRHKKGVHGKSQYDNRQRHCNQHVKRRLFFCQILGIRYNS